MPKTSPREVDTPKRNRIIEYYNVIGNAAEASDATSLLAATMSTQSTSLTQLQHESLHRNLQEMQSRSVTIFLAGPIAHRLPRVRNPAGVIVTKSRLYPELEKLFDRQMIKQTNSSVPEDLVYALRQHVSNNMPRRMIQLHTGPGELKLITGNEIVKHIVAKMTCVDDAFINALKSKISELERNPNTPSLPVGDSLEEDVREDIWGAICDFLIPKFARYAILSHTWLQTEPEISYQDALSCKDWLRVDGHVSDQNMESGYSKLKAFCDVASTEEYNLSLAWCDTICINKESSAELDEAIQSMYKWYQNSSVCITYLSETVNIRLMEQDKWFRRGWTLQELIAPPRIHFYLKGWKRLKKDTWNDKADPEIQEIILCVTAIEAKELISFDPLTGSDIATRMTWAANRETTRGEDQAYSLMGIFGVHFPISYGEGAERAFFRLIQSIISSRHTSHIISTLNWAGKSISDRIHASRLIPSGPQCYTVGLQTNQQDLTHFINFYPTLSDPMTLTHLGLRVRLLVAHAQLINYTNAQPNERRGPFDINLNLRFPKAPFENLTVILNKRYLEVPKHVGPPHLTVYLVGIYTFKETANKDTIEIPLYSPVFIIQDPVRSPPGLTMNYLTAEHFEPAVKIDTRIVHCVIRRSNSSFVTSGSDDAGIIKKDHLKGMGMKLLNVYL